MRMAIGIAAVLAVGLGLVGIVGFRFGGHCRSRDPAHVAAMATEHVNEMLDEVGATPEQRTQILAIKDRLVADGQKLHEGHAATHDELLAQWKSDQPDAARLHALVDQRTEELRAFANEAVDAAIQVHGILTPEQRAKLAKKAERHARR